MLVQAMQPSEGAPGACLQIGPKIDQLEVSDCCAMDRASV